MELDDLKKTWNVLDKQLQKENLLDESQVAELITQHKTGASKGINRIRRWQKLSVAIGICVLLLMVLVVAFSSSLSTFGYLNSKVYALLIFLVFTVIGGMWWDIKTYNMIRKIRVDEMPVVTVIKQINTFKKWMRYELIIVCGWVIIFFALYYWNMGLYHQPFINQLLLISVFLAITFALVFLVYKKLIYNNLEDVRRNLNDLKDLS